MVRHFEVGVGCLVEIVRTEHPLLAYDENQERIPLTVALSQSHQNETGRLVHVGAMGNMHSFDVAVACRDAGATEQAFHSGAGYLVAAGAMEQTLDGFHVGCLVDPQRLRLDRDAIHVECSLDFLHEVYTGSSVVLDEVDEKSL